MKVKLLLAGGLVIAGIGYIALKPKADVPPNMVTKDRPAPVAEAELEPASPTTTANTPEATHQKPEPVTPPEPTPQDHDKETQLSQTLQADPALARLAVIHSVQCSGNRCTIEMEAKEDEANIQMPMFEFIRNHPEYGQSYQFFAREDNPKVTQFTISKE